MAQVASYTNFFADALIAEAEADSRVVGIHSHCWRGFTVLWWCAPGRSHHEIRLVPEARVTGFQPSVKPYTLKNPKYIAQVGSYTNFFADALIAEAEADSRVVGIHAAMGGGTGMNRFEQRFPERTFDVGIAEQARALQSSLPGFAPCFAPQCREP